MRMHSELVLTSCLATDDYSPGCGPSQGLRLGSFDCLADVWAAVNETCGEALASFLHNPQNMTGEHMC